MAKAKGVENIGFFTCQQHAPDNFWDAGLQRHANGARGLRSIVVTAENPADLAEFLSAFTGQREMLATSAGLEIALGGSQKLEILTPTAFAFRFGAPAPDAQEARLAAVVVATASLDDAQKTLQSHCAIFRRHEKRLLLGPDAGAGLCLAFEEV